MELIRTGNKVKAGPKMVGKLGVQERGHGGHAGNKIGTFAGYQTFELRVQSLILARSTWINHDTLLLR